MISAGAGDCKVYVTDCTTSTPFQVMTDDHHHHDHDDYGNGVDDGVDDHHNDDGQC